MVDKNEKFKNPFAETAREYEAEAKKWGIARLVAGALVVVAVIWAFWPCAI